MNILQFGCNDGDDELYKYIAQNINNITKVHLVDANPFALEKAKIRYLNILPESKLQFDWKGIICNDQKTITLYYPTKQNYSGHSAIYKEMLYDDWGHDLQSIEVPANEPCYFLDQYSVIDYLWIDVEGLDTDIVQYIDFTKYKIKQIRFESAHSDGKFVKGIKYQNAIIKLTQANYLLHSDGLDTVGYLA